MDCPDCDGETLAVRVPPELREFVDPAPETVVAVCPGCLCVRPSAGDVADVNHDPTADPSAVNDAIPDGNGGVAFLLACGKLDSLAVNRPAVVELMEYAEREGVDVLLALDRLGDELEDPHFDVDRRARQLAQYL
ncbi:DUF6276 family protein [Halopenitus salinus]|uniref:DUF6276 family protein n=1 Tax=Halopenitus salinus TaxID=1198295 RepID=A0ABD5UYH2_9EURY